MKEEKTLVEFLQKLIEGLPKYSPDRDGDMRQVTQYGEYVALDELLEALGIKELT